MINWQKIPFVRLLIPFVLGVLFAFLCVKFSYLIIISSLSMLILALLLLRKRTKVLTDYVFGIVLNLVLFFTGAFVVQNQAPHFYENEVSAETYYRCKVIEPVKEKAKSYQLVLFITEVIQGSNIVSTQEKVLAYIEKDSSSSALQLGASILIKPNFKTVEGPKNPEAFNYKNYLANKSIYRQGYIASSDWILLPDKGGGIYSYGDKARSFLLKTLKNNGVVEEQFAIASALIVGSKDELDYETKQSYATAGAMHVLAVSGLHVGIVYLILNVFLSFLDKSKKGRYIKALLLIFSLWTYALVTGLSPSVLRAATMFSFVIIGIALNRKSSIYNTLAASAFLLLLINPNLIFEVGFQLSYVAVLGIVYLQPLIYKKIHTKWWLLDKIWGITAVSIAAQIATLPLTLYYFHQFPTYFMLSNLIVIPAAVVILGLGILLFLTSPIPVISEFIGWILNKFIQGLNLGIEGIENLPNSLIEGVSINILECVALYLIILLFIIGFQKRKLKLLNYGVLFVVVFVLNDIREDIVLSGMKSMVIYHVDKSQAINFIDGKENVLLASDDFIESQQNQSFHVKPYWASRDLYKVEYISINARQIDTVLMDKQLQIVSNYTNFCNEKMVRVTNSSKFKLKENKLRVDYVLISENSKTHLKDLYNYYDFKKVIVDGSNSKWNVNRVVEEASLLHISIINTNLGAFIEDYK